MNSEIIIKSLLSQQAHFQVNKMLIRKLGLDEAALLSVLVDGDDRFRYLNEGWFYTKSTRIQHILNIGRKPYDAALKNLVSSNLVETKRAGCPPTTHFRLNYDKILEYCVENDEFVQNGQFNLPQTDNTICSESTEPYNKEQNNKKQNKDSNTPLSPERGKDEAKPLFNDYDVPSNVPQSFTSLLIQWWDYKKEKGQTYKRTGWTTFCNKLVQYSNGDFNVAKEIIETSIMNNYAGIFKPKNNGNNRNGTANNIDYRFERERQRLAAIEEAILIGGRM